MKKIILMVIVALLFHNSTVFAGGLISTCEIPKFITKGLFIHSAEGLGFAGKVVDIDEKACWIKVKLNEKQSFLVNLKQVKTLLLQK